jgi:hypothetical protein
MTGICRRLLAAFFLILVAALLRGQDTVDRTPVLTPDFARWGYSTLVSPAWIDSPAGSPVREPFGGYPVGRGPVNPFPIVPRTNVLPQLIQAAGIIFSGCVTSVGRGGSVSGSGTTSNEITFRVQEAMRGVSSGQNLTIREWGVLWANGERYHLGECVTLFLYPPSKLGLTSPVAAAIGRFAMDSRGMIVLSPQHVAAFAGDLVIGGKTLVPYSDFVLALQRYGRQE